ncbi:MAG: transposase [Pseudomonadota bacterium]|nr:transposase [Pseudomonadota bacterium]
MNPRPPPHAAALRKGRVSETGRPYLLTTVVEGRRPLFADWRIGRLVVAEMRAEQKAGRVESLAWVLMPDHLHWLVSLREGDLETLMRRVKSRSAIAINAALGSEGRIWQKGYHDHAAREEEDLQAMARYVVANPLRAGLVQSLRDYPLWDAIWLP